MAFRKWCFIIAAAVVLLLTIRVATRLTPPTPALPIGSALEAPSADARQHIMETHSAQEGATVPALFIPQGRRVSTSSNDSIAATLSSPSVYGRLIAQDDAVLRVPPEKLDAYLASNRTNAGSLLAAWQASGDRNYLRHAAEAHADDPKVQLSVITMDLFPDQRRAWIDRFKQSDPQNALANYLSAREYFAAGQPELALAELDASRAKGSFTDYTAEKLQDLEEVQMLAGRSAPEAKAIAGSGLLLPHLRPLRELAGQTSGWIGERVAANDLGGAEAAALAGWSLTQHLISGEGSRYVVNQVTGVTIQEQLLAHLPASSQPSFLEHTVQEQLAQVASERQALEALSPLFNQLLARGESPEIIAFFDRMKLYGEDGALKWLQGHWAP